MSLSVRSIRLENFRSFSLLSEELSEGLTILAGPNAVGKTNTIEALRLLTGGRALRSSHPSELIKQGCASAAAAATLEGDGRILDILVEIEPGKKRYQLNGKPVRGQTLSGILTSVPFTPDDLVFSKGSASHRRQELDSFGSQMSKGYDKVSKAYLKAVEQRNALLKNEIVDTTLLDAWDESLTIGAASLLHHRLGLFERISRKASAVHAEIAAGESLEVRYDCSLGDVGSGTKEELEELMSGALIRARHDDLRRQMTTVGPQRDDIAFLIDGKDVRAYGSQGQQRSVVLSWKMAEVLVCQEVTGERPLLLLDDVMSELDANRRAAMMDFIETGIQTVVTTTNLGYFSDEVLDRARVVMMDVADRQ